MIKRMQSIGTRATQASPPHILSTPAPTMITEYLREKEEGFFMDMPSLSGSPARLYALLLKLRPLEAGTLMPFSGELVHGAWLAWIREAAPDVAAMLHDGNKRRLFTCSSLQFPLPRSRMLQAERDNIHLPLEPEKTYNVRITLLLSELFPLFYNTLMHFNMAEMGSRRHPFMRIGKQVFLLEEVVCAPDDASDWTGFTSFAKLVDRAMSEQLEKEVSLSLEFASLTAFNWMNREDKSYGNYYARLPSAEIYLSHAGETLAGVGTAGTGGYGAEGAH